MQPTTQGPAPRAALPGADPALDCRQATRFRCRSRTAAWLLPQGEVLPIVAEALDLSVEGVGLLCEQRLEPGAVLRVQLSDLEGRSPCRGLAAWVAHVTPRDDGRWLVGCEFRTPLREEEVRAML